MEQRSRIQLGEIELCYAEFGAPDGRPLFYFHGWPGSRLEALRADRAARARSLRVIAIDRPGIGGSSFRPERKLTDWPPLIERIADCLDLRTFSVLGVSGGGPYALSCAASPPARLEHVGVCSGIPHYDWLRTDRSASLPFRFGLRLADLSPAAAGALLQLARLIVRCTGRFDFLLLLRYFLLPHDQVPFRQREIRALVGRTIREAFRAPSRGLLHDIQLLTSPWGFGSADLATPVRWWHGARDHLCPVGAVRTVAAESSLITLEAFDGEGHYSLPILKIEHILDYFA